MQPLSYTRISAYQSCPLSYKLQYIDGLEPEAKWYFSFGDTLHKCAEHFFRASLPTFPPLEELLIFYDKNWVSEGWESTEQEAAEKTYGQQIMREFWRINSEDFLVPLATERLFTVDVEGVKLRGYIDRIDKLDTGGLSIVDYKSNRELFTKEHVEQSLQLTLYQIACGQMWDMPVERLTLYHLRSNTPVSSGPRDQRNLDEAKRLVLTVAEGIVSGDFPAVENQYCPCDFPEYCPYYKHKYGENILDIAKPEPLKGVAIDEVVERYSALQDEKRMLEKELDELKELLIQYCELEQLNRVFGHDHAITYKIIERTGYDEGKVRAVLDPAGLWDKVLKFDPAAVKSLAESDDVPAEVKERVANLLEVVSTYPRLWVKAFKEDREE